MRVCWLKATSLGIDEIPIRSALGSGTGSGSLVGATNGPMGVGEILPGNIGLKVFHLIIQCLGVLKIAADRMYRLRGSGRGTTVVVLRRGIRISTLGWVPEENSNCKLTG